MLFQSQPSGLEIHICSFSDRRWILLASNAGLHCFSECHCLLGCVRDTVLFYRLSKTKWHYQTNSLWLWALWSLCSPTAENHFICHHLLPTLSPPHMAQGMGIIITLILSWLLTPPGTPHLMALMVSLPGKNQTMAWILFQQHVCNLVSVGTSLAGTLYGLFLPFFALLPSPLPHKPHGSWELMSPFSWWGCSVFWSLPLFWSRSNCRPMLWEHWVELYVTVTTELL